MTGIFFSPTPLVKIEKLRENQLLQRYRFTYTKNNEKWKKYLNQLGNTPLQKVSDLKTHLKSFLDSFEHIKLI